MKYTILISIFLLFSCNNAKKPIHCTEYINGKPVKSQLTFGLKGNVKALVEVESWSPYGRDTYDSTTVIEFNALGFVTKHQDTTYQYEFNDKGLLVTAILDHYMDKFIYNEEGSLFKYHRFPKGQRAPEIVTVFEYEGNRLSKSEMKEYQNGHEYVTTYFYNNDGSYKVIRPEPNNKFNDTLIYNVEGLLIKSTEYFLPVVSLSVLDEATQSDPVPLICNYEYSDFDETGNWRKCNLKAFKKGVFDNWASRTFTRRIVYN